MAVLTFMCREYCKDTNKYHRLRDQIARRITHMNIDVNEMSASFIYQFTQERMWEKQLKSNQRPPESGLTQLLGDAFSSLEDDALLILKASDRENYPWNGFAKKLAQTHSPTADWLSEELRLNPEDRNVQFALGTGQFKKDQNIDIEGTFKQFLQYDHPSNYNQLRFTKNVAIFPLLGNYIEQTPHDASRLKKLCDY